MKVYLVQQKAVYNHDTFGIFTDIDRAKEVAVQITEDDSDDHHSYEVHEFNLDEVTKYTVSYFGSPCSTPKIVSTHRKTNWED